MIILYNRKKKNQIGKYRIVGADFTKGKTKKQIKKRNTYYKKMGFRTVIK